jgi:type IV secretory pathway TrbL component
LTVLLTAVTQTEQQVVANATAGLSATRADIMRLLAMMVGSVVVEVFAVVFVWKIPYFASSITGGSPISFMNEIGAAASKLVAKMPTRSPAAGGAVAQGSQSGSTATSVASYTSSYQPPGPAIHRSRA